MTVEIRFLSLDWETSGRHVGETEVVDRHIDPFGTRFFEKGQKMLVVSDGISRFTSWGGREDDGASISFWDEDSNIKVSGRGNRRQAGASDEIGKGGFATLAVDGKVVAEIRHIPGKL